MCIIFFTTAATCEHKHFLGSYHCGYPGCSIESQHLFPIEDSGYNCETCTLLDGSSQLSLRNFPVKMTPTTPYIETMLKKEPGMWFPKVVVVSEVKVDDGEDTGDWCSNGGLSDVDSVTSHWRLDKTENMEKEEEGIEDKKKETPALATASDVRASEVMPPPGFKAGQNKFAPPPTPDASPDTAKHRNLVLGQLANLPGPFPPHNMPTPAFQPTLPAGLPKYPLPPPGLSAYPVYLPATGGNQPTFLQAIPGRAMQHQCDNQPRMSGFAFNPRAPEWQGSRSIRRRMEWQAEVNDLHRQREAWEAGQRNGRGLSGF